ncbi:MarR family winged helix-turn-helix transcriptional regulator [Microbacterium sp. NPDC055357]
MPRSIMRREGEHLYAAPPETPEGQRLSDAILRLRRAERLQSQRALRSSGLLHLDLTALRYLVQARRDDRAIGPKDLIVMLSTSSANVTNIVERLVRRSLVTREQHPTDRRARYLIPTDEAVRRVDEAFSGHHETIVEVIDGLSEDEAAAAATVISRLADALDRSVADGGAPYHGADSGAPESDAPDRTTADFGVVSTVSENTSGRA